MALKLLRVGSNVLPNGLDQKLVMDRCSKNFCVVGKETCLLTSGGASDVGLSLSRCCMRLCCSPRSLLKVKVYWPCVVWTWLLHASRIVLAGPAGKGFVWRNRKASTEPLLAAPPPPDRLWGVAEWRAVLTAGREVPSSV